MVGARHCLGNSGSVSSVTCLACSPWLTGAQPVQARPKQTVQLAKSVMMHPQIPCRLAWTAELNSRGSRNRGCPQPCSIGLGGGYLSNNGNANFAPAARMTLSARELSEETHDWYVGLIESSDRGAKSDSSTSGLPACGFRGPRTSGLFLSLRARVDRCRGGRHPCGTCTNNSSASYRPPKAGAVLRAAKRAFP